MAKKRKTLIFYDFLQFKILTSSVGKSQEHLHTLLYSTYLNKEMDKKQQKLLREVKIIWSITGGAPLTKEEEEKVKKLDQLMVGETFPMQSYSGDYCYLRGS